jgi:hypothetical protein
MNTKEYLGLQIDTENGIIVHPNGKQLGYVEKKHGYVHISYKNKTYKAHRVIYECHHNVKLLPTQQINHINHVRTDNRIQNLEVVTNQQNAQWTKNKTGQYKGVQWNQEHNQWRSELKYDNKSYNLGYYDNEADAAKAYNDFALYLNQTKNCMYLLNEISEPGYIVTPRNVPEENKQELLNNKSCSYLGVQYHKTRCTYNAQIKKDGKSYFLGSNKDPLECAKLYNQQAAYFNAQNDGSKYNLNENIVCEPKNIVGEKAQTKTEKKSSKYFGVSFSKQKNKWIAVIVVNKKQTNLGSFEDEIEAAEAYNKAAIELNEKIGKAIYKINQ